jgi:hypothetical protein
MGEWRHSSTLLDLGTRWIRQFNAQATLRPRERALYTPWIGGWVGPKAGLDDVQ